MGGGFGGVKTALDLADNSGFEVTLMSDNDSFRYYPALYHVATGGSLAAASLPLAEIFKGKNVKLVSDSAKKLDREAKKVSGKDGDYKYDTLIIALGVVTNYFGIKGLKEYSYGIKSQADAQQLREHIHEVLTDKTKPELNYVVIGGGPTGVELAAALPSYIDHVRQKHGLRAKKVNVEIVEAAPRLMPHMPQSYSKAVAGRLRRLEIKLYLHEAVQAETPDKLSFSGGSLQSRTVVWTAGVTNHPFFDANKFGLADHGKVKVDEYLQAEPDIYVIGDNAGTPYSGMAQTALYDAKILSDNLKRKAEGRKPQPYRPKKPIYVTPVGPGWAAVLWNNVHFYGRLGWLLRSAADLAGYKDYQPWWPAAERWLAEYTSEDTCPVCAAV